MPGLVKIGKTTNTPNQRMRELHSTGVPTPFELECSISTDNCHEAEKSAHKALGYCRVSKNREFFRVTAKNAIEKILEVVDECEVVEYRESHGIEKIEAEVRRRKKAKEEDAERRRRDVERKLREQERKETAQRSLILEKLQELQSKLQSLGPKPSEKETGIWTILAFCYWPAPIGWIFWIGMLSVFDSKKLVAGLIFMTLVMIGYFASQAISIIDTRNNSLLKPFYEIEDQIKIAEQELKWIDNFGLYADEDAPDVIQKLQKKLGSDLIKSDG